MQTIQYSAPVTYGAPAMQTYSAYASPGAVVQMPTISTAVPTVSYGGAQPVNAVFDALDRNHDGNLSRAELAAGAASYQYSAPVTYAPAMQTYPAYASPGAVVQMPTISTAVPTVSYGGAQPVNAVFDALDRDHDGKLSSAELAGVVRYGSPQMSSVIGTDRRLMVGNVIGEQHVSRQELLAQGRLIPDDAREQQLNFQASQIPGYMQSPYYASGPMGGFVNYNVGGSTTQNVFGGCTGNAIVTGGSATHYVTGGSTTHYVTGGSATHHVTGGSATHHVTGGSATHHVTGGSATHNVIGGSAQAQFTGKLEISLLQADGLQNMNHFTGDNLYAYCEIVKRNGRKVQHCQTKQVSKTLSPVWNELHHLDHYEQGDDLKFTVYDHGLIGSKTEGFAVLHGQDFFPQGFEGALPLSGGHATISVRVVPLTH